MGLVTSRCNDILNDLFCTVKTTPAKQCYLGLSTSTPNPDGSNFTEPSVIVGYKRVLLGKSDDKSSQKMSPAKDGRISNKSVVAFPIAIEQWGTITHFGLFASETDSTPYYIAKIGKPIAIPRGYLVSLNINTLKVSLN